MQLCIRQMHTALCTRGSTLIYSFHQLAVQDYGLQFKLENSGTFHD